MADYYDRLQENDRLALKMYLQDKTINEKVGAYKKLINHISRLHAGEVARAINEISEVETRMEQDDEE